jgi:DNA-binding helix-hairpin-helix protein with protein kinase domain
MRVRLEKHPHDGPLDCRPLVRGGEALVCHLPGLSGLVAKLYHAPGPDHAAKLAAMLATPPADPMAGSGHVSIAWPVDRVVAADEPARFVGYVMPRVEGARPVFEFYNPRSRLRLCPLFHYGYLLRTARNLAAAVRAVHDRDYVVGDLNETNTLVTNQALVTLVDTDSFQVPDHGRVYRCPVGKPEYTPPELQQVRFADFDRGPEHDAFALAVLIFQLLQQGVHPFAGRYTGAGEPGELARRIALGQWPYARSRRVPYEPPPLAPPFAALPPAVQELMRRCFEGGHARSALRPTAAQWQEALTAAEQGLARCPANPRHLSHPQVPDCPWCALARRLGRDPFPGPAAPPSAAAGTEAHPAPSATPPPPGSSAQPAPSPLSAAVAFVGLAAERKRPSPARGRASRLSYPVPHPAWSGRHPRPTFLRPPISRPGGPGRAASALSWLAGLVLAVGALTSLGWLATSHGMLDSAPPRRSAPDTPPSRARSADQPAGLNRVPSP